MDFDKAFEIVVGIEGGYVSDELDPGGETKFGISKKAYPDVDIANLTLQQAKDIYKKYYWDAIKTDGFPYSLRLIIFDTAVNCGQKESLILLQRALEVFDDGIIGPNTLNALDVKNPLAVLANYGFCRYEYYKPLKGFAHDGNGWVHRIMTIVALSQTE